MFDAVSYNKGGQILHMLRNHIGDSAFFKSLNLYLTSNKFKAAEAHHLRLAFEEVTGKDLNWFFNQWYFGSGHPALDINYVYNENAKTVDVVIKQTQAGNKVFQLPFAIDIYIGGNKTRHHVWLDKKEQTFTLPYQSKPDLVNVDGDKILLAEKKDNKTLANYIHQYKYAGNYTDRREAIDASAEKQDDPQAVELLKIAIKDKYHGLRSYALGKLDLKKPLVKQAMEAAIADVAKNDKKSTVRATAIGLLSNYNNDSYKTLYLSAVNDSSYSVAGAALAALAAVDPEAATAAVKRFSSQPLKGQLAQVVTGILIEVGKEEDFDVIYNHFKKLPFGQQKLEALQPFARYLGKVNNTENLKKGVDEVVVFRDGIPAAYKDQIVPYINNVVLGGIVSKKTVELKGANGSEIQKQIDYIRQQIAPKKS
jgi:aminopeptidase N